jgi:flavin reductase (DIM6/NTAB) family NADH-FMN oxidoreductase RutF
VSTAFERPFDTRPACDQRAFRDALGCFATGVTIIAATAPDGTPVGMTANSFSSVSLQPPLILFSIRRAAHSLAAFQSASRFAVNVLAAAQMALSDRFATPGAEKWGGVDYELGEGGSILITGSLASFECAPHKTVDGGDHIIFIARVLRFRRAFEGDPLLYYRSAYRGLAPSRGASPPFEDRWVTPPLTCFDPWFGG